MNTRHAMFPGTFDPPTLGHIDIIDRTARLYDKVYVVIADNINKKSMFTAVERKAMLEEVLTGCPNVEICIWQGLVVDFARKFDIGVIVRGVRALVDFNYEFELAETYKQICPDVEVLFLPTNPTYFLLRSSGIKEMAAFGADISSMVPEVVVRNIDKKLNSQKHKELT